MIDLRHLVNLVAVNVNQAQANLAALLNQPTTMVAIRNMAKANVANNASQLNLKAATVKVVHARVDHVKVDTVKAALAKVDHVKATKAKALRAQHLVTSLKVAQANLLVHLLNLPALLLNLLAHSVNQLVHSVNQVAHLVSQVVTVAVALVANLELADAQHVHLISN